MLFMICVDAFHGREDDKFALSKIFGENIINLRICTARPAGLALFLSSVQIYPNDPYA